MKGIILAGGSGSRLAPVTNVVSKQLLPIYDKPMIYYSLSVLMLANIREILIISTPQDITQFERLLGDGSELGVEFTYLIQQKPDGIAKAFIIGEDFIGQDSVALILGDNIFYGQYFSNTLIEAANQKQGATIFTYVVQDSRHYGVAEMDKNMRIVSIEEKPQNPKSNYAVTGLYFYDNQVVEITKTLKPSVRGELEITDVNKEYLRRNQLKAKVLSRGFAWLDTGTHESLQEAANFVQVIQKRQGQYISCIEEIAYRKGFITKEQMIRLSEKYPNSDYGQYLRMICFDA